MVIGSDVLHHTLLPPTPQQGLSETLSTGLDLNTQHPELAIWALRIGSICGSGILFVGVTVASEKPQWPPGSRVQAVVPVSNALSMDLWRV